jgi:hypothetical protein
MSEKYCRKQPILIATGDVMENLWVVSRDGMAVRQQQSPRARSFFSVIAVAACGISALAFALSTPAKATPTGKVLAGEPSADGRNTGLVLVTQTNANFSVQDIIGKEDEPIPLRIVLPPNPTAVYSFLMFQGLPAKFAISAGFATKNQWAVSLHDVGGLNIIPPTGYTGAFTLDVLLIKGKDQEPERRSFRVEVLPSGDGPVTTATVPSQVLTSNRESIDTPATPPAKKAPAARPMDDEERLILERGDLLFRQGDVAAARLIYHRLAKKGIAPAALAMARTYDPDALKSLKVEGLQPDPAQARVWYKLADELGSPQARSRLSTLRD